MKVTQLILMLIVIGGLSSQNITAQIAEQDIEVPQILDVKDCMYSEILASKAFIPFEIKAFYSKTGKHGITVDHDGVSNPIIQSTPQVSVFRTNFTNTYTVKFQVEYESVAKRAIYFEYWSEYNPTHTEIINYQGNKFCRTFFVSTNIAPQIPSVDEIGDNVLDKIINKITDSINSNTFALNVAISSLSILFLIGIGISILQFLTYVARKRADKKRNEVMSDTLKLANKASANSMKLVQGLEEKTGSILHRLEYKMNSEFDIFRNNTNMLLLELQHALKDYGIIKKIVMMKQQDKIVSEEPSVQSGEDEKGLIKSLAEGVEKLPAKEGVKRIAEKIRSLRFKEKKHGSDKPTQEEIDRYEELTGKPYGYVDEEDEYDEELKKRLQDAEFKALWNYYNHKPEKEIEEIYRNICSQKQRTANEEKRLEAVYHLLKIFSKRRLQR